MLLMTIYVCTRTSRVRSLVLAYAHTHISECMIDVHVCIHIMFINHCIVCACFPLVPFDVTVLIWLKLPFIVQGIVEIKTHTRTLSIVYGSGAVLIHVSVKIL